MPGRPQNVFFLFLLQAKALHHLGNDFLSMRGAAPSSYGSYPKARVSVSTDSFRTRFPALNVEFLADAPSPGPAAAEEILTGTHIGQGSHPHLPTHRRVDCEAPGKDPLQMCVPGGCSRFVSGRGGEVRRRKGPSLPRTSCFKR